VDVPDRLALRIHRPRPTPIPSGLVAWNGYALPSASRPFKRAELLAIAAANGRPISPALLHKWRYWRLIPGPFAGGPTDKGRGKGQTWPIGAAWRVAWISRWLADTLTYDGIRLAIWPWTRELDEERIEMIRDSLSGFLAADRSFHAIVWEALSPEAQDELDPYLLLIFGDDRPAIVRGALDIAGVAHEVDRESHAALFRRLSFDELEQTANETTPDELRAFIGSFRSGLADRESTMTTIFWNSPIGLARILIRELHRYRLAVRGEL
jgi:hypothetical protein